MIWKTIQKRPVSTISSLHKCSRNELNTSPYKCRITTSSPLICWDSSQNGIPNLLSWTTAHHGPIVTVRWSIWQLPPPSLPPLKSFAHNWYHRETVTQGFHMTTSWSTGWWVGEHVCEEPSRPPGIICWILRNRMVFFKKMYTYRVIHILVQKKNIKSFNVKKSIQIQTRHRRNEKRKESLI